jgi:hypothetical protein|tara:strand:+ start:276 stop:830 length:555 start_codon:yes stop_codon:yes gene_type:complete
MGQTRNRFGPLALSIGIVLLPACTAAPDDGAGPTVAQPSRNAREWKFPLSSVAGMERCSGDNGEIAVYSSEYDAASEPNIWMIGSPRKMAARMRVDPDNRRMAGRADQLLVHQNGGFLSDAAFTIQCRDLALMEIERSFVRCQIVLEDERLAAGFDVPARYAGCEGFIARGIIGELRASDRQQR